MRRDRPRFFLSRRPEIRDPGATARARAAGGPRGCPAAAAAARPRARRRVSASAAPAAPAARSPARGPQHPGARASPRASPPPSAGPPCRSRHVALEGSVVFVVFVVFKSLPDARRRAGSCFSAPALRPNVTRRIRAAWSVSVVASFSRSVEGRSARVSSPVSSPVSSRRVSSAARPSSSSASARTARRGSAPARAARGARCARRVPPPSARRGRARRRALNSGSTPRRRHARARRLRNSGERGLERGIIRRRRTFRNVARGSFEVREPRNDSSRRACGVFSVHLRDFRVAELHRGSRVVFRVVVFRVSVQSSGVFAPKRALRIQKARASR